LPSAKSGSEAWNPIPAEDTQGEKPSAFPSDVEPEPTSVVHLVQMNQNPQEQWIAKFLKRTRTADAQACFRNVLGAYTLGQLEYQYFKAIQIQKRFVE
jgi:hypothetical protein